jgi:hypothetical protein
MPRLVDESVGHKLRPRNFRDCFGWPRRDLGRRIELSHRSLLQNTLPHQVARRVAAPTFASRGVTFASTAARAAAAPIAARTAVPATAAATAAKAAAGKAPSAVRGFAAAAEAVAEAAPGTVGEAANALEQQYAPALRWDAVQAECSRRPTA